MLCSVKLKQTHFFLVTSQEVGLWEMPKGGWKGRKGHLSKAGGYQIIPQGL